MRITIFFKDILHRACVVINFEYVLLTIHFTISPINLNRYYLGILIYIEMPIITLVYFLIVNNSMYIQFFFYKMVINKEVYIVK